MPVYRTRILIQAIEHRTCAKKVPVSIHIHFCGTVGIAHNALGFTVQRTPFSAAITGHSYREKYLCPVTVVIDKDTPHAFFRRSAVLVCITVGIRCRSLYFCRSIPIENTVCLAYDKIHFLGIVGNKRIEIFPGRNPPGFVAAINLPFVIRSVQCVIRNNHPVVVRHFPPYFPFRRTVAHKHFQSTGIFPKSFRRIRIVMSKNRILAAMAKKRAFLHRINGHYRHIALEMMYIERAPQQFSIADKIYFVLKSFTAENIVLARKIMITHPYDRTTFRSGKIYHKIDRMLRFALYSRYHVLRAVAASGSGFRSTECYDLRRSCRRKYLGTPFAY